MVLPIIVKQEAVYPTLNYSKFTSPEAQKQEYKWPHKKD